MKEQSKIGLPEMKDEARRVWEIKSRGDKDETDSHGGMEVPTDLGVLRQCNKSKELFERICPTRIQPRLSKVLKNKVERGGRVRQEGRAFKIRRTLISTRLA